MTLEEYISNPMGKNNATFHQLVRETIKANYKIKYENVLLRENGAINYYLYQDSVNNTFYAHIKVPSEKVEKFYYDTVIKFFTTSDDNTGGGKNLEKYQVQFFSNDPAFVFTHAHTFMDNGLFIEELKYKMSEQAINQEATEKNPNNSVGYVKTIYFAYLYLKQRGFLKTISYKSAEKYDKMLVGSRIMVADAKIELRQEEEKKRDKRKKLVISKDLEKRINKYDIGDKARGRLVTGTTKTAKVKNTKAVNTIKTTAKIKNKK